MATRIRQEAWLVGSGLPTTKTLTVEQFFDLVNKQDGDISQSQAYAKVAWVYRCLNLRCDTLAGIPYVIKQGEQEIEIPWPLQPILWAIEASLIATGHAFVFIERSDLFVQDLVWLNPLSMSIEYDAQGEITGFVQNKGQAGQQSYDPDEVIYLRLWALGTDKGPGVAPLTVALEASGLALNSQHFASRFFRAGAIPAVVLQTQDELDDDELDRLKRAWRRITEGVKKAFSTVILRRGVTAQVIGMPIKDLAMPELLSTVRGWICVAFGVPETMLSDAANYATAKEHRLGFYQDTVIPNAKRIEAALQEQFFGPLGYEFAFEYGKIEIMQQQEAEKAQATSAIIDSLIALAGAGVLSLPETRAQVAYLFEAMQLPGLQDEGPQQPALEPEIRGLSPEGWADCTRWAAKVASKGPGVPFHSEHIPSSLASMIRGALAKGGHALAFSFTRQVSMAEHERILREATEAIFQRFQREWTNNIIAGDPIDYAELEQALRASLLPSISNITTEMGLRAAAEIGVDFDTAAINQLANEWARTYTFDLIRGLSDTTRQVVSQAMQTYAETPGITRQQLEAMLTGAFGPVRAELIAVTEATRAAAQSQLIYQSLFEQEAGIKMVREWGYTWSGEDTCPICLPLNGVVENEGGQFIHPESGQAYEGPPAHVKCNCFTSLRYQRQRSALLQRVGGPGPRAWLLGSPRKVEACHCDGH